MAQGAEARDTIREAARAYEAALPAEQRKQLGQFFTGVRLGKLLAHLAIDSNTRTILDPMAGHGDLLDATREAAGECGITLGRLDGIEIDSATASMCRDRLSAISAEHGTSDQKIVTGNAFALKSLKGLPERGYDLVITNPPFVRYQTRNGNGTQSEAARAGLLEIADSRLSGDEGDIWKVLIKDYSGLADLSVPAWLLAGLMVRPGGRFALVVPATWRSRNYADVIRYLLLRCFSLEVIVADTQPGWFSDALVRTHLIVARRLQPEETHEPLCARDHWRHARWLQIAPDAANDQSLVSAAFEGQHPEAAFATWIRSKTATAPRSIEVRDFDLRHEWTTLQSRISRLRWYRKLERGGADLPLFADLSGPAPVTIPDTLRNMLPPHAEPGPVVSLEAAGVQVGQGLRTGCNRFFYVTACGSSAGGMELVKTSPAFGSCQFCVPSGALRPVLHRQSEIDYLGRGEMPPGRVLDLRGWVLPEDAKLVAEARAAYTARGETPPRTMPDGLAAFVRHAAVEPLAGSDKQIPTLSAVRTNVRIPRNNKITPRFWYMLPDFATRHLPAAFVARINHTVPWVETNCDTPLLIDANFSTFWASEGDWTRYSLKALLNSIWCRAFMETLGTPLGGGALKLEATHLRQMLVPSLTDGAKVALDAAGKNIGRDAASVQAQIDVVVLQAIFPEQMAESVVSGLARDMAGQTDIMRSVRQRMA